MTLLKPPGIELIVGAGGVVIYTMHLVNVAVETLEEISATLRRIEHLGVSSDTRWKV
jgi:hypothetical protein